MIKKILFGFALLATVASCTDDYTDWSQPQSNPQEDAVAFGDGSVAPVGLIDFANIPEGQEMVQVCTITAPTASDELYKPEYKIILGENEYDINANGEMSVADLENYVISTFGRRPAEREIDASLSTWVNNGSTAVKLTSGVFKITAKPEAPQISDAYYIIGEPGAWDPSDVTLKFNHSGNDVYDDPVFTITIPVADTDADGNMWFAISDAIAAEAYLANPEKPDWSKVIGCAEGNGKNTEEGKVARRAEIGDDGSFVIPVDGTAKFVKITLNMMDYSYKIEKLNFQEILWVAGSGNNWAQVDMVSSPSYNGEYKGFMYLGNDFKFCSQPNWNGTNYGDGFSTDPGAGNMTLPAGYSEGYYMVDMSLASSSLVLTPIHTIGIIGNATANGWDASTPLTYNPVNRCWEADVVLTDGEFKFRANDGWDISWGGDLNNLSIDNAPNITVAAGAYHIALYPNCPGKAYAELTAN